MENGLYYRAHHPDAPWWGGEYAETAPVEDSGIPNALREKYRKPGYSSFWNPHHLSEYMSHMGWDPQDRWVVGFRGRPIGEGIDGEPRVMPISPVPEFAMPWQRFEDNLEATPNGYGKWNEHTWGEGPEGKMVDDGYRTLKQASHQLAWLPAARDFKVHEPSEIKEEEIHLPERVGMAADPAFIQNWINRHGPYVYHDTHPERAESILQNGLLPWDHPDNPQQSPYAGGGSQPRPGHVYLKAPGEGRGRINPPEGTLRIDLRKLDPALMNPDEDLLYHYPSLRMERGFPPEKDEFHGWKAVPWNNRGEYAEYHQLNDPELTEKSIK